MNIIYEPSGKAKEYCDLAANLYSGCSHGCRYCYAPAALRRKVEIFRNAAPRKDVLKNFKREIPAYRGQTVHFSFTCDPYQPIEEQYGLTRTALEYCTAFGVRVSLLTKGGIRSLRDLKIMKENNSLYGATLTFLNDVDSVEWEPGAALPQDRLRALQVVHDAGLETWVSMEPVIDPAQTLRLIEESMPFVDMYKIGKWNHDERAKKINWQAFTGKVVDLLEKNKKNYMLKKDLLQSLLPQRRRLQWP